MAPNAEQIHAVVLRGCAVERMRTTTIHATTVVALAQKRAMIATAAQPGVDRWDAAAPHSERTGQTITVPMVEVLVLTVPVLEDPVLTVPVREDQAVEAPALGDLGIKGAVIEGRVREVRAGMTKGMVAGRTVAAECAVPIHEVSMLVAHAVRDGVPMETPLDLNHVPSKKTMMMTTRKTRATKTTRRTRIGHDADRVEAARRPRCHI